MVNRCEISISQDKQKYSNIYTDISAIDKNNENRKFITFGSNSI